jgi:hypothetical protein
MRAPWSSVVGLLLVGVAPVARAAIFDPAFTQTPLVSAPELADATGLAWAPDGPTGCSSPARTGRS